MGSIRGIAKTNLTYIEPHRIYINNNLYLAFNYSNEIYIQNLSKNTKHPTYYSDVVESIMTKEFWEECQVQQKKNSRSYQRTLTYLFLQKLKCPKCYRILGGKATTKKNGKAYFYYYCHDCNINIKENTIESEFDSFMDSVVEYDTLVNQYFLPLIKQKIKITMILKDKLKKI